MKNNSVVATNCVSLRNSWWILEFNLEIKVTLVSLFFKSMFPNIPQHNSAGSYLLDDIVTPSLCLLMTC